MRPTFLVNRLPALAGAAALLLLAGLSSGCGQATATPGDAGAVAQAVGPHGGTAIPLSGGAGYAEVVVEPLKPSAKAAAGGPVVLAVYFLGADLKSALATTPTAVSGTFVTPDDPTPKPMTLRPAPLAGKADAPARFASGEGPFDYDELRGELEVTLGGTTTKLPFSRR